jgi:hypothetical protein
MACRSRSCLRVERVIMKKKTPMMRKIPTMGNQLGCPPGAGSSANKVNRVTNMVTFRWVKPHKKIILNRGYPAGKADCTEPGVFIKKDRPGFSASPLATLRPG